MILQYLVPELNKLVIHEEQAWNSWTLKDPNNSLSGQYSDPGVFYQVLYTFLACSYCIWDAYTGEFMSLGVILCDANSHPHYTNRLQLTSKGSYGYWPKKDFCALTYPWYSRSRHTKEGADHVLKECPECKRKFRGRYFYQHVQMHKPENWRHQCSHCTRKFQVDDKGIPRSVLSGSTYLSSCRASTSWLNTSRWCTRVRSSSSAPGATRASRRARAERSTRGPSVAWHLVTSRRPGPTPRIPRGPPRCP